MSDAILSRLARLDLRQLRAKLDQLDQQRRIIVALIRSRPRDAHRRRREAVRA